MVEQLLKNPSPDVQILVALWGEKFINDFLELNFRSLLAHGNIPTLASMYSTKLVILTTQEDIPFFEENLVFKMLKKICPVYFIAINDLIVFSNYSTTLTLAYDRAIRNAGEKMLNTYFIFLTSDYIMADGSFEGLIRYMKKGYSGICAGNFQVVEEHIKPFLIDKINTKTQALSIKPRDLLKKSFKCLHPISYTNIYHQDLTHNYYANRFFLKYSEELLAGRFYLLHMLCIKPETMDYKVGASCDYSFIPEMCPSGSIAIINDSDDYLVVEMQSKKQDLNFIQSGKYDFNKLASALAAWTTKQHRENANHTIYYHSKDLCIEDTQKIEEKLNNLISVKLKKLSKYKCKPYYKHPYWIGAIKAFKQQKKLLQTTSPYDYLNLTVLDNTILKKCYYKLFGVPPFVYFYHYRRAEYQKIKKLFQSYTASANSFEIAVFYDSYQNDFMQYCQWFDNILNIKTHFYIKQLLVAKEKLKELKKIKFKICILMIRLENLSASQIILQTLRELLKKEGKLIIFIPNERNFYSKILYDFQNEFIQRLNYLTHSPFKINKIDTIHSSLTFLGEFFMHYIKRLYSHNRTIKFLIASLSMIPLVFLSTINNLLSKLMIKKSMHCTNIIIDLTPSEENMI